MNTFREGAASTETPFSCEEMINSLSYIGKISQEEMAKEARDIIVLGLKLELHTGGPEVKLFLSSVILCPVHWNTRDHQPGLWELVSGQKQGQYYLGQPMKAPLVIFGWPLPPCAAVITGCHDKTEDIKACTEKGHGRSLCP